MIKIVYGKNGTGKSRYAQKKASDDHKRVVLISSLISKWYDPEQELLSEFLFLTHNQRQKINELENDLLSQKSSLFKTQQFSQQIFKVFLEEIVFINSEKWLTWKPTSANIDLEIDILVDLVQFIKKNFALIKKIDQDDGELIALLASLIFLEKKAFKGVETQKYLERLTTIKKIIREKLEEKGIDFQFFLKLKTANILKIFTTDLDLLQKEIVETIKNKISTSKEVLQIKNLQAEIKKIEKRTVTFPEGLSFYQTENIQVLDRGKTLKVDLNMKNASNGERIQAILKIILFSLVDKQKLFIFDNFFEKLDIECQEEILLLIAKQDCFFEILVRDEKTVETFMHLKDVYNLHHMVKHYQIQLSKEKKPVLRKNGLNLTFKKIISSIYDNNQEQFNSPFSFFARIFARYVSKSGSLSGYQIETYRNNNNALCYRYASENIYHYNNKVNHNELETIFGLSKIPDNILDSIDLLNYLVQLFEQIRKKRKYGLTISKIKDYLKGVIVFLEEEKRYFLFKKISQIKVKKTKFYRSFWHNKEVIKPNRTKEERDKFIHSLDNTLSSLN